jgi:hypothetical protein
MDEFHEERNVLDDPGRGGEPNREDVEEPVR